MRIIRVMLKMMTRMTRLFVFTMGLHRLLGPRLLDLRSKGIVNAGKSSKDSTRHLEAIARIGAREHWLVSTHHMHLLPDALLGQGDCGVVVLGLVHGTRGAGKLPHLANDLY